MTQAAVAKKIPCSLPHLNATINNDRRLSGQKLFRLCEIANATKAEREDVAFALMLDILGGKYEKLNLSPIAKFMTDPLVAVQKLLRHSSPAITVRVYGHVDALSFRQAINESLPAVLRGSGTKDAGGKPVGEEGQSKRLNDVPPPG